jgi:hypothetical protein
VVLAALAVRPAFAAADGSDEILAAAREAEKSGLELCRYGTIRYAPGEPSGGFALLRKKSAADLQLAQALFRQGKRTWSIKIKEKGLFGSSCTETGELPGRPPVAEQVRQVSLSDLDGVRAERWDVTLFGGELVLLQEVDLGRAPSVNHDWEKLRSSAINSSEEDPSARDKTAAIIPVLPADARLPASARLPKTATFVTHGSRSDTADADLDVRATLSGETVTLTITIVDDLDVPLRAGRSSDAQLLRSDHVELWYQEGASVRQLGIARLADGTAQARWLHPPRLTAPLPVVAAPGPGTVTVQLPFRQIFRRKALLPELAGKVRLTAAFSDTDRAGRRQQTLVATSTLRWGDPSTFGELVWFENGGRFPRFPKTERIELQTTAP